MSEFYIGQVMMTGFNFAQKYFAQCNGQLMPINQNQALFSLLGTYYGGNGSQTFALPNLQGRGPVGYGSSVDPGWQPSPLPIGTVLGAEQVTLSSGQMPIHNHLMAAQTSAGTAAGNPIAAGSLFAQATITNSTPENIYGGAANMVPLATQTVGMAGGNQPHPNMQPTLVINFNIATSGIYPSRN